MDGSARFYKCEEEEEDSENVKCKDVDVKL